MPSIMPNDVQAVIACISHPPEHPETLKDRNAVKQLWPWSAAGKSGSGVFAYKSSRAIHNIEQLHAALVHSMQRACMLCCVFQANMTMENLGFTNTKAGSRLGGHLQDLILLQMHLNLRNPLQAAEVR